MLCDSSSRRFLIYKNKEVRVEAVFVLVVGEEKKGGGGVNALTYLFSVGR